MPVFKVMCHVTLGNCDFQWLTKETQMAKFSATKDWVIYETYIYQFPFGWHVSRWKGLMIVEGNIAFLFISHKRNYGDLQ